MIVTASGIEKYFGSNHVLRGMDLEVRRREAVMVIGRSGSGKTTFLRCINFLEEPTVGFVEIDGLRLEADPLHARSRVHQEQIRQMRLRAGMLFQEFNLFPHMTVLGNCIEAPMRVRNISRDEAVALAEAYLDKVGVLEKRDEFPVAPVRRTEAAGRHRPRALHGAQGAPIRRADQRPRPGADR